MPPVLSTQTSSGWSIRTLTSTSGRAPETCVEILLDRRDRYVVLLLWAECDRDIDSALILGDPDILYPGGWVDLAPAW